MKFAILTLLVSFAGCGSPDAHQPHDPEFLVPLDTLRKELKNPEYQWNGPTSVEDRIPRLHAARALAYRGDSAAPILFDAIDDSEIEIISVLDALSELGIPVRLFRDEIKARDSLEIRKWWDENRTSTLTERNNYRKHIGLPPATIRLNQS